MMLLNREDAMWLLWSLGEDTAWPPVAAAWPDPVWGEDKDRFRRAWRAAGAAQRQVVYGRLEVVA